jgi:hypothetical protein
VRNPTEGYDSEAAPAGRVVIVGAGVERFKGGDPCGRPPVGVHSRLLIGINLSHFPRAGASPTFTIHGPGRPLRLG